MPVTATTQLAVLSGENTINTINWPIRIIGLFEYYPYSMSSKLEIGHSVEDISLMQGQLLS